MSEGRRNFIVGLTTVFGLVGFAYLMFIFGEMPTWVTDTYRVTVSLNHAGGLSTGSRVRLNGVDVGHVEAIRLEDDPRRGVIVYCQVRSEYGIPAGAEVTTTAGLLGGAAQLAFRAEYHPGVEPDMLPRDDTAQIRGRAPTDFATLTAQLEQSVQEQLRNFGQMTDKLTELSDQYIVVGQRVADLLEQRDPAEVDAGRVPANVTTMLARADARLNELQVTMDAVNELVGDEQVHEDIRQTVANARLFTEDARRLTERADQNLDTLLRRFVAVADDLSRTLDSVDQLMADAREGEGTVGRLLRDPALYDNLQDAAGRLSDALREAQLLIEKWRAEGLPVQF